jgi:hypothetical protein
MDGDSDTGAAPDTSVSASMGSIFVASWAAIFHRNLNGRTDGKPPKYRKSIFKIGVIVSPLVLLGGNAK